MSVPEQTAWTEYEPAVDEQAFTPWAKPGWLAHNGQSPEVAVVDFVVKLVRMMQPEFVVETGVGQGYMTRALAATGVELVAYESDDEWRHMLWTQDFWRHRSKVMLAPDPTPSDAALEIADLAILDSEFVVRFDEIRRWHDIAKPGAVAIVHDTSDREGTIHKSVRELIQDLGMTGVFLNNPRGCFMAVQPKEKHDGSDL